MLRSQGTQRYQRIITPDGQKEKDMSRVTVVGGGTIRPSDENRSRGCTLHGQIRSKTPTPTRVIPVESEVRYTSVQIWFPPPTSRTPDNDNKSHLHMHARILAYTMLCFSSPRSTLHAIHVMRAI